MSQLPRICSASAAIHAQLTRHVPICDPFSLPDQEWLHCSKLGRQLDLARRHGWKAAEAEVCKRLGYSLERCDLISERLQRELAALSQSSRGRPTVRQVHEELQALTEEFPETVIDLTEKAVSVRTEFIVLEGVELGRFQIRLQWDQLGRSHPYSVAALDPNPAPASSNTFHPHVDGETLCEGEGQPAIRYALLEGRLLDFFVIVNRILHNYNSSSAYVPLAHWNGLPCSDCGTVLDPDSQYSCDRCGETLCGNCLYSCEGCDSITCHSCMRRCAACDATLCRGCADTCSRCGGVRCANCLNEQFQCQECCDADQSDDDEPNEAGATEGMHPSSAGNAAPNPETSTADTAV